MKNVISTVHAPAAVGPYSQAIETQGMIYASGQIALHPTTGEMVGTTIAEQTEQVMANIRGVLAVAGVGMDRVVKTTCMLADINDFAAFNEVYAKSFLENPPARSCYAVAALPKGALVEVEVIALKNPCGC